jgi:hypothetical protein
MQTYCMIVSVSGYICPEPLCICKLKDYQYT